MKIFMIVLVLFIQGYTKEIIGKNEHVTFEDFNLQKIRAKVDTGARTSSLHCSYIKESDDGRVFFILLDEEHKKYKSKVNIAKISRIGKVRSSNGKIQKRYFIKTNITLLGKKHYIEFSLNNRKSMKFPVLIGRNLLKKGYIVDVSKEYTFTN